MIETRIIDQVMYLVLSMHPGILECRRATCGLDDRLTRAWVRQISNDASSQHHVQYVNIENAQLIAIK